MTQIPDDLSNDERAFLEAIRDEQDTSAARMVYQDWLEEHGDERAEYLHLQSRLASLRRDDPEFEKLRRKFRKLQQRLQSTWRAWMTSVSQAKVENCPRHAEPPRSTQDAVEFEFECPQQWDQMQSTDDERVRFCEQCSKHVYFCETVHQANRLAIWNACVAIDESARRRDGDLIAGGRLLKGRMRPPAKLTKYRNLERERNAGGKQP